MKAAEREEGLAGYYINVLNIFTARKKISGRYCFELCLFFFFFFFFFVTTITLERLNTSKPKFYTLLLTGIAQLSSKMGITGHMV